MTHRMMRMVKYGLAIDFADEFATKEPETMHRFALMRMRETSGRDDIQFICLIGHEPNPKFVGVETYRYISRVPERSATR